MTDFSRRRDCPHLQGYKSMVFEREPNGREYFTCMVCQGIYDLNNPNPDQRGFRRRITY